MEYALTAIGLLAGLAVLGWWLYGEAMKLAGELANENRILREGVEAHDRADRILAEPVASGGKLRARLLARAVRGLPESGATDGASTLPGP